MENKNNVGWIALFIGIIFFISIILSYTINFFGAPISDNPSNWGVFGDFVGGITNPLLGLVTIALLTFSLHQNNEMLDQARKELKATLEELKRGQEIQAATEKSLQTQIEIAKTARDIDGTIKLISYWQAEHDRLIAIGRDEVEHARTSSLREDKINLIRNKYNNLAIKTLERSKVFDHILDLEEKRLLKKYPIDETIYE